MGKLIVIEGTDCSGKETQANLIYERLLREKVVVEKSSFPMYDTPTGKIIGGPYLGKKYISEGIFPEGAANVEPTVATLLYAADRKYNEPFLREKLEKGDLILDRYIESNMAHQGGKIKNKNDRLKMYKWIEELEYKLLKLPKPDGTIFLYVPFEIAEKLKKGREEKADQHESNKGHLKSAENAFLELASLYDFMIVSCTVGDQMRSKEDIHEEVYSLVKKIQKK